MSDIGPGWNLPRGRNHLPREVVREHQRDRMLEALARAVSERGISNVSVSDVLARAGVSRATFYENFDDLQGCLVASYRAASEQLIGGISEACGSASDWPRGVVAAIDFSLDFSRRFPAQAQLLSMTNNVCDPRLERDSRLVADRLAGLLRAGRERLDSAPVLPDFTEQSLIGGTIGVIGARLACGQLDQLAGLKPELAHFLLAPYLGQRGAARLVEACSATD